MPLDPSLKQRIEELRSARIGGDPGSISSDELASLKAKLASRKERAGYSQNVAELEARIAELEGQAE